MLKSSTPKEGNTKDGEFAAILTLKSCTILGFIAHAESDDDPGVFEPRGSPSSFAASA